MSRLVSALLDRWADQPILVIGGGPSVTADLARLVELGVKPACVISANAHGSKQNHFAVDIGVNVDKIHSMLRTPMEQHMRENLPNSLIINKHSWADYRLPDWRFGGNSGLTAIAVACVLGANPVIATGIDFWHGGRVYFHGNEPSVRARRGITPGVVKRDIQRMKPLLEFTRGSKVRPMSGPLCEMFKQFDPSEVFPSGEYGCQYRSKVSGATPLMMAATRTFMFSSNDVVAPGREIAVSEKEHALNPLWRKATRVLQS